MKGIIFGLVVALGLTACGTPRAASAAPTEVVSTALQATSVLKTAQADYTWAVTNKFPVDYPLTMHVAGMPPHTLQVEGTGTGEVVFPDRYRYRTTLRQGSFESRVEIVSIKGIAYEQDSASVDLSTGKATQTWSMRDPQGVLAVDPFKMLQRLQGAAAVRDLGDTSLAGVAVHHYAIEIDQAKLIAEETAALTDVSLRPSLQDAMEKGRVQLEVWIGVDNNLIRRIRMDATRIETVALHNGLTHTRLPPGASDQGTVSHSDQIVLSLHDFDSRLTIAQPSPVRSG